MRLTLIAMVVAVITDAGALHLHGGADRSLAGAVVLVGPGRLRYHGTHGDGTVLLILRGDDATLRFMPDGGGGGGAFTRMR